VVRQWESLDDLILRTYSLVGLRADVDFMLWRIAFDPLCFQAMEAADQAVALGAYLSQVHSFLSLQRRSPYVNKRRTPVRGRAAAGRGQVPLRLSLHEDTRRGTACRRTRGRG
jgi:chlorite dismutase